MNFFYKIVIIAILVLMIPYMRRVMIGPTVFDRVAALNGIGTKFPVVLVLVGLLFDRVEMFVDLALALFLLNLFTTLLIAKYVGQRTEEAY